MAERRILTIVPTSATVVANMIGTGIFTTTGLMVSMGAGAGDILLGWLLGGVIAFCGALCYGELGANMPQSGGEYFYLSRLVHPSLGFVAGWVTIIVGFGAPIAAVAMALNLYLATAIPGWPVRIMAVVMIIAVAALHSHDLRMGSRIQSALTMAKVLLIILFIVGVFFSARASGPANSFGVNPAFLFSSPFAVVLVFVSFAYSGWNAAAYIGADLRNPERTLPWATLLGTGAVAVLYVLLNISYLSVVPNSELSGVAEVGNAVASRLWGPAGGNIVSLLISVTLLCPLSAMILVGPRVAEAMADDGLLPAIFGKLNDRNVPAHAVAFLAGIAVLVTMTSSFERLLIYIGFTLNVFAALSVLALMRLRKAGQVKHKTCAGYPVTPIVFLVFTIWMTVWSIQSQPAATLAALGTLVMAYVAYLFRTRKRRPQPVGTGL
jgi:APA family basic amino acid/polyamine antiporter